MNRAPTIGYPHGRGRRGGNITVTDLSYQIRVAASMRIWLQERRRGHRIHPRGMISVPRFGRVSSAASARRARMCQVSRRELLAGGVGLLGLAADAESRPAR